jgi:hypothetical protein
MAFRCPACNSAALSIAHRIELPADDRDDEIALQVVRCAPCGFTALADYRESRRGASDRVGHFGHACTPEAAARVTALIAECPAPSSRSCTCTTHRTIAGIGIDRLLEEARGASNDPRSFPMEPLAPSPP